MPKDRLADLRKASGYPIVTVQLEDNEEDVADGGETVALSVQQNSSSFLDDFYKQVQTVDALLRHITEKVGDVRTIHNAIVAAPVADETLKRQLDDITADIRRLSSSVQQKLKDMEKTDSEHEKQSISSAETRIRKYQHDTLLSRFVEVMKDFNMQQVKYRESCRERIQRQLKITGQSMSEEELEDKLEKGDFSVFTQRIIIEKQEAQQMWKDIEDRHSDIMKLESSLKELHDMFQDISVLVESQGEMIDRIEEEVTKTADHVEAGNKQLVEAGKKQRKARKKKICISSCIAITIVVIILVIALSFAFR